MKQYEYRLGSLKLKKKCELIRREVDTNIFGFIDGRASDMTLVSREELYRFCHNLINAYEDEVCLITAQEIVRIVCEK